MRKNRIKQLWLEDKTAVNAWVTIPSSWTAEVMARIGYDAMTIDAQHGLATDFQTILPILQAISTTETVPFVRVPYNTDLAYMMRMLDGGAYGLICPMIRDRADTEAFVQACKYPPMGFRSYGPARAVVYGGDDYFKHANVELITMAMIETADALENIEDIAQTPNLDGLYVGPWDLSLALGLPKMADFDSPDFIKILQRIVDVCQKNKIVAGIQCSSPEVAVRMSAMGFRFVTAVNDTTLLKNAAKQGLEVFKNGMPSGQQSKDTYI
jgi:4-hydroxy-2-oxoheptanedioate aldolase